MAHASLRRLALVCAVLVALAAQDGTYAFNFHYNGRRQQHRQQQQQQQQAGANAAGKDLYGVLGVRSSASNDDVRKAYKKLAREWHPDRNSDPQAQQRFIEINEAHEVLGDERQRRIYDQTRRAGAGQQAGFGGRGQYQRQGRYAYASARQHQQHQQHRQYRWSQQHGWQPASEEPSMAQAIIQLPLLLLMVFLTYLFILPALADDDNAGEEAAGAEEGAGRQARQAQHDQPRAPRILDDPSLFLRAADVYRPDKPFLVLLMVWHDGSAQAAEQLRHGLKDTIVAARRRFATDPVRLCVLACDGNDRESCVKYRSWLRFLLQPTLREEHAALLDRVSGRLERTHLRGAGPRPEGWHLDALVALQPRKRKLCVKDARKLVLPEGLDAWVGRLLEGQLPLDMARDNQWPAVPDP